MFANQLIDTPPQVAAPSRHLPFSMPSLSAIASSLPFSHKVASFLPLFDKTMNALYEEAMNDAAEHAVESDDYVDVEPHLQAYKTMPCDAYQSGLVCEFGERCQDAHGPRELRTREINAQVVRKLRSRGRERATVDPNNYKVRMCQKYYECGLCPYNPHCMFAHGVEEMRSTDVNREAACRLSKMCRAATAASSKAKRAMRRAMKSLTTQPASSECPPPPSAKPEVVVPTKTANKNKNTNKTTSSIASKATTHTIAQTDDHNSHQQRRPSAQSPFAHPPTPIEQPHTMPTTTATKAAATGVIQHPNITRHHHDSRRADQAAAAGEPQPNAPRVIRQYQHQPYLMY
eukprot:PhM_4_TR18741/c4_g1_i1/m.1522/K18753/ZFP36L; butyrate response factor